jgi:hypothetical protein
VARHAEGPHVIGREKDLMIFDWLDFLAVIAKPERKRVWSMIRQRAVHRLATFLIGR